MKYIVILIGALLGLCVGLMLDMFVTWVMNYPGDWKSTILEVAFLMLCIIFGGYLAAE